MVDINQKIPITNLNVNDLNIPVKRQRCQGGGKKKSQLYAVCKKSTLDIKTHIN